MNSTTGKITTHTLGAKTQTINVVTLFYEYKYFHCYNLLEHRYRKCLFCLFNTFFVLYGLYSYHSNCCVGHTEKINFRWRTIMNTLGFC